MTVTLLDIDPNTTSVQVTVQRPSQGALDQNGIPSAGVFGFDGTTTYFDPGGATIGQGMGLGFDGSTGRFFLDSNQPSGAGEEHLMLLRAQRHSWKPLGVAPALSGAGTPAHPWKPLETPQRMPTGTQDPMALARNRWGRA